MGKTELKTSCSPVFERSSTDFPNWRNLSKEIFCISTKFGTSIVLPILPKE